MLGWMLLLPCVVLLAVFAVYPFAKTIMLAFTNTAGYSRDEAIRFSLTNVKQMIRDRYFWESFGNTIWFAAITVALQTLVGLLLALLANRVFRGQWLARAAILLPWAMPPSVAAMAWRWMADYSYGLINDVLRRLSLSQAGVYFLGEAAYARWSLVALAVWKVSSFMSLLILAGLQSIPQELYEAASMDGAGKVRSFFSITLPLIRSTVLVAMLLRALQAVQVFDLPFALTDGGPGNATETMAMYIYKSAFIKVKPGLASAQSTVLLCLSVVMALAYLVATSREEG